MNTIHNRILLGRRASQTDRDNARLVDTVSVDGVVIPLCMGYDIKQGWAQGKLHGNIGPKVYGVVTVKLKVQN